MGFVLQLKLNYIVVDPDQFVDLDQGWPSGSSHTANDEEWCLQLAAQRAAHASTALLPRLQ
jgi:hypothetical protein